MNTTAQTRPIAHLGHIFVAFSAALLAFPAVCGFVMRAQQAPETPPTLRISTKLVVLDVVVTNRKGEPVPGLSRDDFSIFEDGQPRAIKDFESSGSPSASIFRPGKTIIVLDELNGESSELAYSRTCLRKYLLAQKAGSIPPIMLLAAANDGLQVIHRYSTDIPTLLHSLDARHADYPFKAARGFGEERLSETLSFLQQIALATRGENEHKILIWVGRGFPNVVSGNLSIAEEDKVQNVLRQTVNMLLESRISVSKVDPTPTTTLIPADPYGFSDQGPDPYASGVSFNAVVVQTGGRLYFARNDLDAEIAQSARQGRTFYSLSYTPSAASSIDSDTDVYRHIRVAVDRKDLTVQSKHGYYPNAGLPPEPTKGALSLNLWQAATNGMDYSGLSVQLDQLVRGNRPGTVSLTISVVGKGLTYEPMPSGDKQASVYLVISAFSARGKALQNLETATSSTIKAGEATEDANVRAVYHLDVPLPPSTASLRVVVRDARTGRTGTLDVRPEILAKAL